MTRLTDLETSGLRIALNADGDVTDVIDSAGRSVGFVTSQTNPLCTGVAARNSSI